MLTLTRILRDSIAFGLENRQEALDYAADFGRGLDAGLTDRFVGMYVNELTLDYGPAGREALRRFFDMARTAGYIPADAQLEFVAQEND